MTPEQTKEQILQDLEANWKKFMADIHALNPQELADYLHKQGYNSFKDLLAHIVAWRELAMKEDIPGILKDHNFDNGIDTDKFNADAVRKYTNATLTEITQKFEETLKQVIDQIKAIDVQRFNEPEIVDWFKNFAKEHTEEHKVK